MVLVVGQIKVSTLDVLYAKELMRNSMNAIKDEPEGTIDPTRVLEKAYMSTKERGSSTACIITLKDQVKDPSLFDV